MFGKITGKKVLYNISYEVRMKILSSTNTTTVWIKDINNGVTTAYPSARMRPWY